MLYRLAEQSGLKTTGNLRFHNIRKWLMSRLSRCGFNEFQIKYLMGKSIGLSDSTYLQTLQEEIEEKYPRVFNDYLNISPIIGVSDAKKQVETISKEFETTKSQLAELIADQQNQIKAQNAKMEKQEQELAEQRQTLDLISGFVQEWRKEKTEADKRLDIAMLEMKESMERQKANGENLQKLVEAYEKELQKMVDSVKEE